MKHLLCVIHFKLERGNDAKNAYLLCSCEFIEKINNSKSQFTFNEVSMKFFLNRCQYPIASWIDCR